MVLSDRRRLSLKRKHCRGPKPFFHTSPHPIADIGVMIRAPRLGRPGPKGEHQPPITDKGVLSNLNHRFPNLGPSCAQGAGLAIGKAPKGRRPPARGGVQGRSRKRTSTDLEHPRAPLPGRPKTKGQVFRVDSVPLFGFGHGRVCLALRPIIAGAERGCRCTEADVGPARPGLVHQTAAWIGTRCHVTRDAGGLTPENIQLTLQRLKGTSRKLG